MSFVPRYDTLSELFADATRRNADRPLFGRKQGDAWVWQSYADFAEQVHALRGGLARLGVEKGDRVALVANNRIEWAVACYATATLGAQFVPMYEAQQPKEWRFILENSGAKLVFAAHDGIAGTLRAFQTDVPSLEHVVSIDDAGGSTSWSRLIEDGTEHPSAPTEVGSDDIAGFIYTSGTTGNPKGVLLSHGNLAHNVSAILEALPIQSEDRTLSFLPWAHSFGQTAELHTLIAAGGSMAMAESIPKIVDNLAEVQPTVLVAVPRIFNRIHDGLRQRLAEGGAVTRWLFDAALDNAARRRELLEQGETHLWVELQHRLFDRLVFAKVRERFGGRLRFAVSGGAALAKEIAAFVDSLGIVVLEGYGLTETSPVVAANMPQRRRLGTVGRPLPGIEVRIDHEASGDEQMGEVVVYGHCVMQGYFGLPEETEAVLTKDGGLRTGDLGRLDEDGFLSITGRLKEQYKLENGKYVAPAPLEEQLKLAPLIANAVIYGDNRPYNVALIVPDMDVVRSRRRGKPDGNPQQDEQLRRDIESELKARSESFKHYERPKKFVVLGEDFTTDNGLLTPSLKVKRREVFRRYGHEIEQMYG